MHRKNLDVEKAKPPLEDTTRTRRSLFERPVTQLSAAATAATAAVGAGREASLHERRYAPQRTSQLLHYGNIHRQLLFPEFS